MCKRWLATVIQWSPRRTAVWRHGGRRPRWLVEHIYVCVQICACGWDGGTEEYNLAGGWTRCALLHHWTREMNGCLHEVSSPLPLPLASILCPVLLPLSPPRQRKQLKLEKWSPCLTICSTAFCKGLLTAFNDLNQQTETQRFVSSDRRITNPFKVHWGSLMWQKFWAF